MLLQHRAARSREQDDTNVRTARPLNSWRRSVKPDLVCQVAFVEWTDAGHPRHCGFVAMRDDKKLAEVVRET
jgi:ATP-dependent DNA ligase